MAGQDKTEKPTPQRLREARARGDIPSSPEFTAGALGVIGLVVVQQQGGHILNGLMALLSRDLTLAGDARRLTATSAVAHLRGDVESGVLLVLPLMASTIIGGLALGVANTRGLLSIKPLTPSLRKLNPANGIKHVFSKEALILLLKTLAKLAIVAVIVAASTSSWQTLTAGLALTPPGLGAGRIWPAALTMALQASVAFALVGVADLGYRYFAWYRRMRMTKEEVKEEMRRSEGNPHLRARMRQQARRRIKALIQGSGLRRVPQADVVVANPTHYAVAIQYKAGVMRAPKVLAKGQRLVALRIKETARRHNIPIVENKPLAQALFKSVEVNQEIPADLYQAVAQVLAFVYRMRGMGRPSAARGRPRPAGQARPAGGLRPRPMGAADGR